MMIVVNNQIDKRISSYLAQIGRKGGQKSRRRLTPEAARQMTRVREARRAYKKYHTQCFWSFDPNYVIQSDDVQWVSDQLKKNGDRKLWILGAKLCR
jgi:hypothetical protein